jgi:nucleoside-diphosphate-sugar epimerase
LVADVKPEIIYCLASASRGGQDPELVLPTFENDLQTAVNALAAAREYGCRRVIMSGSLEEPILGCKPKAPSSPYAAAKAAARLYGRMFHQLYSVPVVILRVFMTYVQGQKDHKIIPYTIQSMLKGLSPALASGTRLVDWIYVDDVIKALIAAATMPGAVGMEIDVGSGTLTAIREVVEHIRRLIQHAPEAGFGFLQDRANEEVQVADLEAAEKILGWTPSTSLSQGLSKTVEWYRDTRLSEAIAKRWN